MQYLLDSNVFIQAKNTYYAFDICPGFWHWMDSFVAGGDIESITRVAAELEDGKDELAKWAKVRRDSGWFLDVSDKPTQDAFKLVIDEVNKSGCKPAAIRSFLAGADPWLIAKAMVHGSTIVTEEKLNLDAKRKVFIPNICQTVRVPYIGTFDTLRQLSCSFIS